MNATTIIDSEAIQNLRALSPNDGDAFLREILTIFIEDTPTRITELKKHLQTGDSTSFVRAAHSIKGSSSNVGAVDLRAIAEQLEKRSRQNGLVEVQDDLERLENSFSLAKAELEKFIES